MYRSAQCRLSVDRLVCTICEWSTWMHFRFDDCLLFFLFCSVLLHGLCFSCAPVWLSRPQSLSTSNTEIERFCALDLNAHYCMIYCRSTQWNWMFVWSVSVGESAITVSLREKKEEAETTRIKRHFRTLCRCGIVAKAQMPVFAQWLKVHRIYFIVWHFITTEKDPTTHSFALYIRPNCCCLWYCSLFALLCFDTSNTVIQHSLVVVYQFSLGAFFSMRMKRLHCST